MSLGVVPVRVVTTGTSTTQISTDQIIVIKLGTSAAFTVDLYPGPPTGMTVTIKDGGGVAATYNITVTTTDSSTIDGATSFILNNNYAAACFVYNGTSWNII